MGYIRKVGLHLVQKYFPHDCITNIHSCSDEKKYKKMTAKRYIRDSVNVSNAIAKENDTHKNKTGTGYQKDRYERATTVKTAHKTGT